MARRFGGKFSPGSRENGQVPPPGGAGARVDPAGMRANLMFLPAVLLALFSLGSGALGLAAGLAGAGLLAAGAFLLREGLRAEAAYHDRRVARRPAFPRKAAAAVLTGLGAAVAAWKSGLGTPDPGLLAPLIYGLAATVLHGLAFGLDPMADKGMEGIDSFQQDRVARAVGEAETYLAGMTDAVRRARNRQVETRVEGFQRAARDLFRRVEEDPRDLTGARKYLTVYLRGARDATVKFADFYGQSRDEQALADYLALLDDLEQNFAARTRKMLLDDRSDLDVEIDVLRDRLRREGVRPE